MSGTGNFIHFVQRYKLLHISFWFFYTLFQVFIYAPHDGFVKATINALIVNSFHATAVYFNFYFLIPRLLLLRRYFLYMFMLACTLFLCTYGLASLALAIDSDSQNQMLETYSGMLIGIVFSVTFTMVVKIMVNWYQQQQMNLALEKQRAEAELKFLKSQIQPHFLFNVLNNIYSLAIKKSDQTPDVVLRLSEFLRYILYETGDKKISLKKELEYLLNYVELQKVRFGGRVNIDIMVEGTASGQLIEPMLLITFLENSFKHGVGNQAENAWVKLNILLQENALIFDLHNSKPADPKKDNPHGGIGIENVKRRLELLYPGQHELKQEDLENEYHVYLKIQHL